MGKSSGGTSQTNVVKRPTRYYESKAELMAAVGAGGGASPQKERQINQCMINFTLTVHDSTGHAAVGSAVILVPEGSTGVRILLKGSKVATYDGEFAGQLFDCMKLGYTYRGEVTAVVDNNSVTIRVIARGKS